jgi:hypothetical protein
MYYKLLNWNSYCNEPTISSETLEDIRKKFNIRDLDLKEVKQEWINVLEDNEESEEEYSFKDFLEFTYTLSEKESIQIKNGERFLIIDLEDNSRASKVIDENILITYNELLRYLGEVTHSTGIKSEWEIECV